MNKVNEVIDIISKMNMIEISELNKAIESTFGISQAHFIQERQSEKTDKQPEVQKEKTVYSVFMTNYGDNKLNVIKTIRTILDLGLKEAKEFVENLPAKIKENIQKEDAEVIKSKLEESGATIELK